MMTEVEIFKENLDVSRVTLVVTIVLAVTTVVFSALTMAFQRSHNKKTVRPLCGVRKTTRDGRTVILLKNSGLGPMKDCSIAIDAPDYATNLLIPMNAYTIMANEALELMDMPRERAGPAGRATIKIAYYDLYDQYYEQTITLESL